MRTLRKIFSVLILVLISHSNGYERITDDAIIVEGNNVNGVLFIENLKQKTSMPQRSSKLTKDIPY